MQTHGVKTCTRKPYIFFVCVVSKCEHADADAEVHLLLILDHQCGLHPIVAKYNYTKKDPDKLYFLPFGEICLHLSKNIFKKLLYVT
jgi:hypothetical protein